MMRIITIMSSVTALYVCGILATDAISADLPASYAAYGEILGDLGVAWSPDDSKLVYASQRRDGPGGAAVYVVPSRGGTPVRLLKEDGTWNCCGPAWSPDGRRIAFLASLSNPAQLFTSDSSGRNLRQITKGPGPQIAPSWSPDGKQLAYGSASSQIMITEESGGEPKLFASGKFPEWSPDGKRIAYTSLTSLGGERSICVKNTEDGAPRCLTSTTFREGTDVFPLAASWSPDGTRLVSEKMVNGRAQLTIVNIALDKIETIIETNGSASFPAWSHDGSRIAYTLSDSSNPGEIHTITLDGRHDVQVTRRRRYTTAKLIRYPASDGLSIPAWLYKPADKRGEGGAIVWIHGGVRGATLDLFDAGIQYFVDRGYVVIAPNYRGSVGFEEKLEQGRIGMGLAAAVEDLPGAVQYLRSQAGADPARIAAVGFSGGAYLALMGACRSSRMFASVVDFYGPTDVAAMYKARPEMRPLFEAEIGGTPDDKPEAYRSASPIACADQIQAPVLLLHGDADLFCPIGHSARLAEALKSAKKPYEFVAIPGAGHGFFGEDRVRAYDTTMQFLSRWLPVRRRDR